MARQGRSRGWCFTINNPTLEDSFAIELLKSNVQYYIYGKEHGQDRNTFHWQGFAYFQHPVTMGRIKSLLTRAHLEPQRGTVNQAINYCKKDGDFEEWGQRPEHGGGSTQRERWRTLIELAEQGNMERIRDEFPSEYFRYYERIRSLRIRQSNPINGPLAHEWWYGPTGTGKSSSLWRMFPGHYAKELNKWWDGYNDEQVVAIEEWSPKNECTAAFLKVWADRYPFPAQIKGGSLKKIRPQKIIVLSNYTIDECFPDEQDREPIKRRFKVVHFPFRTAFPSVHSWDEEQREMDAINSLLSLSP